MQERSFLYLWAGIIGSKHFIFKGPYYNEYIKIRNMAACRRGGRLQGVK